MSAAAISKNQNIAIVTKFGTGLQVDALDPSNRKKTKF